MSLPVFKRPQVERDIEEAFVFIGEDDFDTGLDFLHAVEQSLEMIGQNPFIGSEREFISPALQGVRMWRVKTYEKYLIFYRVHSDRVEVLRLIHSARDYTRVLDEQE